MRLRHHRVALLIGGLILLAGAGFFAVFGMRMETSAAFLPAPYTLTEPLVVNTKTEGGITTYYGDFPLASQCGTISTGIAALEAASPRITLLFTVLEPANGCDVPGTATQEFSASYIPTRSDKTPALDGVTINGVIAKYTLLEE